MLPDQDEQEFLAQIKTLINDPQIEIKKIMSFSPAVSPASGELWQHIEQLAARRYKNARVIPSVSTGFTDSHFSRDLGIASYGLGFFVVPQEDVRGVHGNDERLGVENLKQGTEAMLELLEEFTR